MNVTTDHLDAIYDCVSLMRLFSQRLSEGEVSDIEAGEMAWLLGSTRKRLEPVIHLLEQQQLHHDRRQTSPEDAVLEIGAEVLAVMERFKRQREARA